jgi:uncharacterized protein YndB with AHSA1/START domain
MSRTVTIAPVRKSIAVKAPQSRAFEVFTAGLGRWWPKSHHIGAAEMKEAIMEPRAGGRWYEKGVDGSECDWGNVLVWEPPQRVVISWHLDGNWKYNPDVFSEVEVTFIADGPNATRVELEHRHLERLGEAGGEAVRKGVDSPGGWSSLLETYAKEAGGTA